MSTYLRSALEVTAVQYEPGLNLEDGFELWTNVVTNGWVVTENLVQIVREDGKTVCPFITNKRGRIYIGKGDYIITEQDDEKHVCGAEKFHYRFKAI